MKRLLIPLITFAAAFAVLQLLLPYSLFAAERDSLFLLTPDYLHEVFSEPLPLTHLLGAFFAQFFYFPYAGAALCALPVAIVAGLLARCFRRWWLKAFPALVLLTGLVVFATNRKMRDGERLYRLEWCAERGRWDDILHIATPRAARDNRTLTAYALLALTESGQLGSRMFLYHIDGPENFDLADGANRSSYLFGAILYDRMGCPAEAVHRTFQSATYLHYSTSFGTLRTLARLYRQMGDDALADKYAAILNHSLFHRFTLHGQSSTDADSTDYSLVPIVTQRLNVNVASLAVEGHQSPAMRERYLGILLAMRDLPSFVTVLQATYQGRPLPQHYQEALVAAEASSPTLDLSMFPIDNRLRTAFASKRFQGTYWDYLFVKE